LGTSSTASGASSVAIGNSAQATQTGAIAIGMNSQSTGANSIAIGSGAVATGSVAVGAGAQAANGGAAYGDGAIATGTNSAAIGSGSVASAPNTVSVGSPGNERRITNVAAGVNPTDAVNVSQLNSIASGFTAQVDGLRTESRRGIAAAVAANGYMMPSGPGKTTVQLAAGLFHGEGAVGITAAHRLNFATPVVVFGSYANGGGSEHVGKVGAGFEF
jgi:autotransporter adhesin